MTFRVGQKVVCVDDSVSGRTGLPTGLVKGAIYTVRGFSWHPTVSPPYGVLIEEISFPDHRTSVGDEAGFHHARFRPVQERKTETGMAILREILDRESYQDRVPERVRR